MMFEARIATRIALMVAMVGGLGGWGRATHAYVRATDTINMDAQDQPRPVALRFYQLKNINTFKTAEFDPLWEDDAAVLGEDMLGQPLVVDVHPEDGRSKPRKVALGAWNPEAKSLGVMALYSSPGSERDRRRVVVSAWHADDYVIELKDNDVHFRKH
jgi:type VI secretion system VasD/TssJ family lipoprotein